MSVNVDPLYYVEGIDCVIDCVVSQLDLSLIGSYSVARITAFLSLDSFDQSEELRQNFGLIHLYALRECATALHLLTVTMSLALTDADVNLVSQEMEKLALVNAALHNLERV